VADSKGQWGAPSYWPRNVLVSRLFPYKRRKIYAISRIKFLICSRATLNLHDVRQFATNISFGLSTRFLGLLSCCAIESASG